MRVPLFHNLRIYRLDRRIYRKITQQYCVLAFSRVETQAGKAGDAGQPGAQAAQPQGGDCAMRRGHMKARGHQRRAAGLTQQAHGADHAAGAGPVVDDH
ncbi:hypothetical protein G6F57_021887 [Rhizopus arrhizus]|nr:hypothetical protein G6F57_021887 [Rhizopus arrhizus]